MTNQQLQDRIKVLEGLLMDNQIPYEEIACECCKQLYMPKSYESCRCTTCCSTCYLPKGSKVWVQGEGCPSKRKTT